MNSPFLQKIRGEGHKEGHKEGHEEGRYEERYEERYVIAKNLKQKGIEVELIASVTGLRIEEVKEL